MSINFNGRVALVTGAGGGLGREHALALAARGAKVVVNDFGRADAAVGTASAADAVVAQIRAAGGEAIANHASVTDEAAVTAMVQQAITAWGRIDILVNNAGILRDKSFTKMDIADFEAVMNVHVMGTMKPTKAVWDIMRAQNYGRIVVTTSSTGLYGNFGQANYGAAKGGMIGLINTLAIEGKRANVFANAVAPMAATRMTEDVAPPEVLAALSPAHVAPVVGHLCSDELTESGSVFVVGGGRVYRVAQFQTKGVTFAEVPSIEEVGRRWNEVSDLDGAVLGANPVG